MSPVSRPRLDGLVTEFTDNRECDAQPAPMTILLVTTVALFVAVLAGVLAIAVPAVDAVSSFESER